MQNSVTVSPKGQITLPKELRDRLSLKPGDELVYSVVGSDLVITPKNIDFNDLAGLLGIPPGGPATLEEIDAAVAEAGGRNALVRTGVKNDAA